MDPAHLPHATAAGVQHDRTDARPPDGITILDEYLAARIGLLEERSPRFHAAMVLARRSPIPIIVGTPDQVRRRAGTLLVEDERLARDHLGDLVVQTCEPGSSRIRLIVLRVYLVRLRSAARWHALLGRGRARRWLDSMTDAILIHELWGHLIPILAAGDLTGRCRDPAPGQSVLESCVMQRENDLRRELGLKLRQRYSFSLPGT